jgi:hypothetical protein
MRVAAAVPLLKMHATLFGRRRRQILSRRAVHLGHRRRLRHRRRRGRINYYMYTSVSEDQWKNDNSHNIIYNTLCRYVSSFVYMCVCVCVCRVGTYPSHYIYIIYIILYYVMRSGGTGIFMDFFIPIMFIVVYAA